MLSATTFLSGQGGSLRGTVHVAGDTGRRVVGAEVTLNPGAKTTRSDATGRFLFSHLASGGYKAAVRRLGFEPAVVETRVGGDAETVVFIALRRAAQAMAEVVIAGARVTYPARYDEAYKRAARGWGHFFTRETIDSLNPLDLKALLQMIPGVLVNDRGVTFQRCQAGLLGPLPSGSLSQTRATPSSVASNPAHVQVYVDGVQKTRRGSDGADQILKEVLPTSIQMLEVYTGVSRIPGEYLNDACAVILIWTKAY